MTDKIFKKTNRLGRTHFVSLVKYKLFGFIPIWLSVLYINRIGVVYRCPSFIIKFTSDSFELAEQSIQLYHKQRQGKRTKKEVRRKIKQPEQTIPSVNQAPPQAAPASSVMDLLVKWTFPEMQEYSGYNVRKPKADETHMILRELAIRCFSQVSNEQFEDFQGKYVEKMFEEVYNCSYVCELGEFDRKIFCFNQAQFLLVDDESVKKLTGVEVDKGEHHHVDMIFNYFSIDKGEVKPMYGFVQDICLNPNQ